MLKMDELNKQTLDELKALVGDLSKEIYELRTELSIARKLEKPHLLRAKKKDRARLMTALRQKASQPVVAAPKKPRRKKV